MKFKSIFPNSSTRYFQMLTQFIYIVTATNFWFVEDVKLPSNFLKVYNLVSKFLEVIIITFVFTGFGASYTQKNLTDKQNTDVFMKSTSSLCIYTMYGCIIYKREEIKQLLFLLMVTLKEIYNDKIEKQMMMKIKIYMIGLMFFGCAAPMMSYGLEGAFHAVTSNATFTTVIPIWPDLEDRRLIAGFTRILIYIVWLLLIAHVMAIYSLIISISICLGYQYVNLCEYFLNLHNIFDGEGSQEDWETRYEEAVKVGIKMHVIILRCVNQLQSSCKVVYGGQVLLNVCVMLLLLIQMMVGLIWKAIYYSSFAYPLFSYISVVRYLTIHLLYLNIIFRTVHQTFP
uniref:Putative odorant receptor OR58 n=1 Tax=Cydia nigricana TaxID=753170 RepID=A0A223HDE3_9NEOP|nr:putative odorant receptor OR58 [Cydia nigricana]